MSQFPALSEVISFLLFSVKYMHGDVNEFSLDSRTRKSEKIFPRASAPVP